MKIAALALSSLALLAAACASDPLTGDVLDDSYYYGDQADKADTVKTGRFETFVGADGQIYFHLLATNGEKVLASQGYGSLEAAEAGIASVRWNGVDPASFALLQASDGQWTFDLKAPNGAIIGTGELYVSKENAERGIETVTTVVNSATYGRASTSGARFQLFKGLDGQYYFHLRAGNGAIVLQSEGYTTKASAQKGEASVQTNAPNLARFKIKDTADGSASYFTLTAANNQVIGVSQTYADHASAQRAASTVSAIVTGLGASLTP